MESVRVKLLATLGAVMVALLVSLGAGVVFDRYPEGTPDFLTTSIFVGVGIYLSSKIWHDQG